MLRRALLFSKGIDEGAHAADPHPNSDGARAAFITAANSLGAIQTLDFESLPLGQFIPQNLGQGIRFSQFGLDFAGIFASADYNTTPGGNQYLFYSAGAIAHNFGRFIFPFPIQAFGAYFFDVASDNADLDKVFLDFNDGTTHSFKLDQQNRGIQFFGFVDAAKDILSVGLTVQPAIENQFGVDDVNYVFAATPEPPVFLLLLVGSVVMTVLRQKGLLGHANDPRRIRKPDRRTRAQVR